MIAVFVQTNHPAVFHSIARIVGDVKSMQCMVAPFDSLTRSSSYDRAVLVIDGCSVRGWARFCRSVRVLGIPLVLLLSAKDNTDEEMSALYLGVRGILPVSSSWERELAMFLEAVLQGKLCANPRLLAEYAQRMNDLLCGQKISNLLTIQEDRVLALIKTGLSNKEISDALGFCERTAKFHVSNILRKLDVRNRRELLALQGALPIASHSAAAIGSLT
jgi:DNA-binding NarL/FixJ family response regulator